MEYTNASSSLEWNTTCSIDGVMNQYPTEWEISKWIRCVEFGVTITLNVFLLRLLKKTNRKSNLLLFVFHLVLSDIAVAVFHILPLIVGHFMKVWLLGEAICKLKFYLSNVVLFASTYMIVVIAIDRLLGVIIRFGITRQRRRYKVIMVLLPWLSSFLVTSPTIKWTTVVTFCGLPLCTPDLRGVREIALLLHAIFLLFLPLCVLIACYSGIVWIVCKGFHFKHMNNRPCINEGLMNQMTDSQRYRVFSRANRRSIIMTFVVSLTFICCWLPSIMAGILNLYGNLGYGGWFDILIALAPLNSMVNPVVFMIFNRRIVFKRKLGRRVKQIDIRLIPRGFKGCRRQRLTDEFWIFSYCT